MPLNKTTHPAGGHCPPPMCLSSRLPLAYAIPTPCYSPLYCSHRRIQCPGPRSPQRTHSLHPPSCTAEAGNGARGELEGRPTVLGTPQCMLHAAGALPAIGASCGPRLMVQDCCSALLATPSSSAHQPYTKHSRASWRAPMARGVGSTAPLLGRDTAPAALPPPSCAPSAGACGHWTQHRQGAEFSIAHQPPGIVASVR